MADGMLARWREWLNGRVAEQTTETRTVRGIPVVVVNTRPDIRTEDVFARLDVALGLIEQHVPWHFRHLVRDFTRILVQRYPCRGAYVPGDGTCIVELTFSVNRSFNDAQIAATILHEGMHARLDRLGIDHERFSPARHERFCRRAEVDFGERVPGGEPVIERALASLAAADEDVAPAIDWNLASERVRQADIEALNAPDWVKRALGRNGPGSERRR